MPTISAETKSEVTVLFIVLGCVGAAILLGIVLFEVVFKTSSSSELTEEALAHLSPLEKAEALLKKYPVIDGHNDLPWNLRKLVQNDLRKVNFSLSVTTQEPWASYNESFTDIPRLRKGHVGAQFWVAYTDCESQGMDSVSQTLEQIDVIHRLSQTYPDDFVCCASAKCIEGTVKHTNKIASLIGIEGGHSIQNSSAILRQMYRLGVRYMTLTHSCNTPWADASPVDNPDEPKEATNDGLSPFGLELIDEMNRLGMMVDLSHVSEATMKAALRRSMAPVIFSHSGSKALCDHHRNVGNEVLQELKKNGGVIMINFYSKFVQCDASKNATIQDVVRHIQHIRALIGHEHIGIGADYDGVDSMPIGLEDVSKYPNLFSALIEHGWNIQELKGLAYSNILRVMKQVEKVSSQMQDQPTMHSTIPDRELEKKEFSDVCITPKSLAKLVEAEIEADNSLQPPSENEE